MACVYGFVKFREKNANFMSCLVFRYAQNSKAGSAKQPAALFFKTKAQKQAYQRFVSVDSMVRKTHQSAQLKATAAFAAKRCVAFDEIVAEALF
jgi:hypothetical protein